MTAFSTIRSAEGLEALQLRAADWLGANSRTILRLSMGLIFLGFGLLKFFPGISPAEGMAVATFDQLTLGLLPNEVSRLLIATFETVLGVLLLTGWVPRIALAMLALQIVGILSPLVLISGELFAGPFGAPTLEGQYVLKDMILAAAALVIAGDMLRASATREAR
jgi:putative oxidoreductase